MTGAIRVGTRASPLARAQTETVVRALAARFPGTRFEAVALLTEGDRRPKAVDALDFTDRIDRALEAGEVDLAVHSAKDLPGRPPRAVAVAAYPRRADPRDCLVLARPGRLETLPPGARVGTSSVRRRAQLLRWRPDLEVVPLRGNVGTRIAKVGRGGLDGAVLAAAGLLRLGWEDRISQYLPVRRVLPAPGQGALAVAVRAGDAALARRVRAAVDHGPTRAAVTAERAALAALGGDCDLPLGALARVRGGRVLLAAALFSRDGRRRVLERASGPAGRASTLGGGVGRALARRRGEVDGASDPP